MSNSGNHINEIEAALAFSAQSTIFDEIYKHNQIIQYKRSRVRSHILHYLQSGSNILELNAGTGDDAIYFAQLGHTVWATDISEGMMSKALQKIREQQLTGSIHYDLCSYTELSDLKYPGPFDYIFSNFAGLNCTDRLKDVVPSFGKLLKPGGVVTLVIMPGFCLWEALLLFKGKFNTAFRRLKGRSTRARVEGKYFNCTYYSPSEIINYFNGSFELLALEGLCTIVPPSYFEHFADKHPRLYNWLKSKEEKYKSVWPWKNTGDYYIISFRKIK